MLAAVAAKIRQQILMGSLDRLEAAIARRLERRSTHPVEESGPQRLAKLEQQIARAANRLLKVDDSLVADLQQQLLAMKRERDQLAAKIEATPAPKPLPSARAIASKLWELDRILTNAPATAVRHALNQLIDHVRLDFLPGPKTRRGQAFRFAGGLIKLRVQDVKPLGGRSVTMGGRSRLVTHGNLVDWGTAEPLPQPPSCCWK